MVHFCLVTSKVWRFYRRPQTPCALPWWLPAAAARRLRGSAGPALGRATAERCAQGSGPRWEMTRKSTSEAEDTLQKRVGGRGETPAALLAPVRGASSCLPPRAGALRARGPQRPRGELPSFASLLDSPAALCADRKSLSLSPFLSDRLLAEPAHVTRINHNSSGSELDGMFSSALQ